MRLPHFPIQLLTTLPLLGALACLPQTVVAQTASDVPLVIVVEGNGSGAMSGNAAQEITLSPVQIQVQPQGTVWAGSSTNLAPAFQSMIGASPSTYSFPAYRYPSLMAAPVVRWVPREAEGDAITPLVEMESEAEEAVEPPLPNDRGNEIAELRSALDQAQEAVRISQQEKQVAVEEMAVKLERARLQYEELNQRQQEAESRREEHIRQLSQIRQQLVAMRTASERQQVTIKQLKAQLAARDLQVSELKVKLAKILPAEKAADKVPAKPARPRRPKSPPKKDMAPAANKKPADSPAKRNPKSGDQDDQVTPQPKQDGVDDEAIKKLKISMERQIKQATEKSQRQVEQSLEALNAEGYGKSHPKSRAVITSSKLKLDQQIKAIRQRIEARIERLKKQSGK